jgi:hypothetical protein
VLWTLILMSDRGWRKLEIYGLLVDLLLVIWLKFFYVLNNSLSGPNGKELLFPPKRSQVQIQRGVGYVYLRRLYQSNR